MPASPEAEKAVKRRVVASENPLAGFVADYMAARDQAEAEEIVAAFYRTNADAEELARRCSARCWRK
jgi:hypothetical protein